jgi:hypothetical protein
MALGGHWPLPMGFYEKVAGQFPGLEPKDREHLLGLISQVQEQQLGAAVRIRGTAKGEPLLQGVSGTVELKDGQAWLAATKRQLAWCEARFQGAYGVQEGVLPELPSFTVTFDFSRLLGDKPLPPQAAMVSGLLFGGTRLTISQALVEGRTAVYAFGAKEALRQAVDELLQHKPLASDRKLQSVDRMLPKDARFSLYLDPAGFRNFLSAGMVAFGNKAPGLPEVGDVPPLAGTLSMDPGGLQFTGVARVESLEAIVKVFSSLNKASAGPKASAEVPPPAEKAPGTGEEEG